MTVGKQATGAYGMTLLIERQRMQRIRVGTIPLQFRRNLLLDDKYRVPHGLQQSALVAP